MTAASFVVVLVRDGNWTEGLEFSVTCFGSVIRFGFGVASCWGAGVGLSTSEIGAGSRCAENSNIDTTTRNRTFALTVGFNQKARYSWRR
jgi:hypothetical protein